MPTPVGLVVKKGSKTRDSTSADMPSPIRRQQSRQTRPARPLLIQKVGRSQRFLCGRDRQRAALGHRVAGVHRQIQYRAFELVRVDRDFANLVVEMEFERLTKGHCAFDQLPHATHEFVWIDDRRLEPLKTRKHEQSIGQSRGVSAACRMAAKYRPVSPTLPSPMRRSKSVRPLVIACSILLKSCAMPPVSCPTASIF